MGALAGVLVVLGWHTGHSVSTALLFFDSVPVRYNTGICMLLAGMALLLLARRRTAVLWAAAAPLTLLGWLTTAEYIFNINLGLDDLFFDSAALLPASPPRMAPNTAVCFTLLGGALLLAGGGKVRNTLQALAASLPTAVGLAGFIGYIADIPSAYGWGRLTPMAAPTAAVIVTLGLGVAASAWRQHAERSAGMPAWAPALAAMSLAASSVALWQALHILRPESRLDVLALGVGLLQAGLLYLVLHLLRGTRERAGQLRQLNGVLQAQMGAVARAEGELRAKQAYTRSLIEASLDPLVTIAPDGKITDVNAATETVTGCSRQELIGADFCDYFTEPDKARAGYQQVFREGGVRDYELEIRHRDGHLSPVLYNASVYHDQGGGGGGGFCRRP
jgi:PAS domain S-box-containing protein